MEHWTGLLTELTYFPFWTSFYIYFLKYIFKKYTSIWLLWATVAYCSVIINKSQYIATWNLLLYIVNCLRWKRFVVFANLIDNHSILFQHNNSPLWYRVWPPCNRECFKQITAEFYNRETSNSLNELPVY